MSKHALFALLSLALLAVLGPCAHADEILTAAASSLTNAFNEIGAAYTRVNPQTTVRFNFASSGALQQQIEQGAPVDVFAAAAPREMDALVKTDHIVAGTRIDFAANRLVLIVRPDSSIRTWSDLAGPAVKRIAISNPASVPSGRYAQEVLTRRGLWAAVQPKAVMGENVRQTLAYVMAGDVDAGVVYATDARIAGAKVRVAQTALPGKDHDPIIYPAAVVAGGPDPASARRFVQFLQSRTARSILIKYGFTPLRLTASRP